MPSGRESPQPRLPLRFKSHNRLQKHTYRKKLQICLGDRLTCCLKQDGGSNEESLSLDHNVPGCRRSGAFCRATLCVHVVRCGSGSGTRAPHPHRPSDSALPGAVPAEARCRAAVVCGCRPSAVPLDADATWQTLVFAKRGSRSPGRPPQPNRCLDERPLPQALVRRWNG